MASYTDKKGNRITLQEENGLICLHEKGRSSYFYTLEELIDHINRSKKIKESEKREVIKNNACLLHQ